MALKYVRNNRARLTANFRSTVHGEQTVAVGRREGDGGSYGSGGEGRATITAGERRGGAKELLQPHNAERAASGGISCAALV